MRPSVFRSGWMFPWTTGEPSCSTSTSGTRRGQTITCPSLEQVGCFHDINDPISYLRSQIDLRKNIFAWKTVAPFKMFTVFENWYFKSKSKKSRSKKWKLGPRVFFKTIFVSSHMYPENPEGTQVNRRLNEHGIYIRHCQESNSQPVPSQAGADPTKPQWRRVEWLFWWVNVSHWNNETDGHYTYCTDTRQPDNLFEHERQTNQ